MADVVTHRLQSATANQCLPQVGHTKSILCSSTPLPVGHTKRIIISERGAYYQNTTAIEGTITPPSFSHIYRVQDYLVRYDKNLNIYL